MKENNLKGVWTKFLAVLIAVAMVIPLAFSGWASNRVYADDGDSTVGETPSTDTSTDGGANDTVKVKAIDLNYEFPSALQLDNTISTSDFSAVGDATALGLTRNVWVEGNGSSADLYVDYDAAKLTAGMSTSYDDFKSKVIGQIHLSAENQRGDKKIDVAGVLIDGKNQEAYVTAATEAREKAEADKAQALKEANKDEVKAWLDSLGDVPEDIKTSLFEYLGGSIRKLMKDTYSTGTGNYLAQDEEGNMYAVQTTYPKAWFRVELSGGSTNFHNLSDESDTIDKNGFTGYNNTKKQLDEAKDDQVVDSSGFISPEFIEPGCAALAAVVEMGKKATEGKKINVVWPYIGSYNGRKIGMKLEISNIEYLLDARTSSAIMDGNYSHVMTPAFQIAGLPQFGLWQHNVNSADYDVKLFYIGEDENGNEIKDTNHYITPDYMQDVYFTFSSLSTYNAGKSGWTEVKNKDGDTNIAPGEAGAAYERNDTIAVNEMVKPISTIKDAFVTEKTNIAKGKYDPEKYLDDGSTKNPKYGNTVSGSLNADSVTGNAMKYSYDCNSRTATLTTKTDGEGKPIDGYFYAYGWENNDTQKANTYSNGNKDYTSVGLDDDIVGMDNFTRHAVTLQFASVEDMKFNMNSTTNETWFSIYPQGMTYNQPAEPTKSMVIRTQKNVYDNDQTSAKENQVLPGDTVRIIIEQRINELNANALIKYDSFSISDSVPAELEVTDYYLKTTGFDTTKGKLTGWKTHPDEADKVLATKSSKEALVELTETKAQDGSTEIKAVLDPKFVNPSRYGNFDENNQPHMTYDGESYYLVILAKVKEGTDLGAITNQGETKIGNNTHPTNEAVINVVDESALDTKVQVSDRTKPLTFEVVKSVPNDATKITLLDNIDSCFELDAAPVLYYLEKDENGNQIKKYVSATTYQGEAYDPSKTYTSDVPALIKFDTNATPQNITYHSRQAVAVTIANGSTKADKIIQNELAGKTLHLSLRVKIKEGVDDDVLLGEHGENEADIPNLANVKIDNTSDDSKEVDVELVSDLRIEKATTDSKSDKEFEFTVDLKDIKDNPLTDEFKYNVYKWKGAKELPKYVASIEGVEHDELAYVRANSEIRKNTSTKKFLVLFNEEYYRADANDNGASSWEKVSPTEGGGYSFFENNWNKAPFEAISANLITGVSGIEIPADADTTVPGTGTKTNYELGDDDQYYKVDDAGNKTLANPQPDPKTLTENDQTFTNPIKIRGGEWAIIKDLPVGAKYSITEKPAPGYTNTAADGSDENSTIVVDGEIDKVVGQIHAKEDGRTRFVNTPTDEPQKRVTDDDENLVTASTLNKDEEVFTYTITQKLGKDASKVVMTDELDKVLELYKKENEGELKVVDENGADVEFNSKIGKWEGYNAPVEELDEKKIEIETLKQNNEVYYVKATNGDYYTRPKNGDGKWYKVTENGHTDLDGNEAVDGKDASGATLAAIGDVTSVIENADITPISKASGTKVTVSIKDNDNGISVAANKTITITFKAKIIKDADLSEYVDTSNKIKVPNEATVTINGDPKITNEVTVTPPTPEPEKKVGLKDDLSDQAKNGTKASEKKFDEIEKEEDEIPTLELPGRDSVFTYTVSNKIPVSAKTVVFGDTLENVLEVAKDEAGAYDVKFLDGEGNEIPDSVAIVDVKGDRVVTATIADATEYRGQTLTLVIKAKIKDGVTDTELRRNYDGSKDIPNYGTVKFDDNPELKTNTVTVTPPDAPEKFVNDIQDADVSTEKIDSYLLDKRADDFEYKVTQIVPEGAKKITFTDTLEDVLEYVQDSATLTYLDGETEKTISNAQITGGQTVEAVYEASEGQTLTDVAGKKVILTFRAKIKDGITDTDLMSLYGQTTDIPNKATVDIDGHGQTTNEVLVTPPPVPEKHINNETHAVLKNKDEVFTYTVDFFVPVSATVADFTDTLNDVLVPANVVINTDQSGNETSETITEGEITATVKGGSLNTTKPFNGKTLAFTLEGEELNAVKGQKVTVTFKAIFDQENETIKNIAAFVPPSDDELGDPEKNPLNYEKVEDDMGVKTNVQVPHKGTPNEAHIKIKPDNHYETSNKVTVTPPSTEPGDLEVTKTVTPEGEELTEDEKKVEFPFTVTFYKLRDKTEDELKEDDSVKTVEEKVDASTLVHEGQSQTLKVEIVDAEGNPAKTTDDEGNEKDSVAEITDVVKFNLKHGEIAKITGVPGGYTYKVEEGTTTGYEIDSKFGDTGEILANNTVKSEFKNKSTYVEPGELDILKTVAGMENIPVQYRDTEFVFEVDLEGVNLADLTNDELAALDVKVDGNDLKNIVINEDETFAYETGVVKDGKIIAVLKSGETAKITGIPADTKANTRYVVEEQDVAAFENTSSTNASGNVTSGNTTTAVFINEFHQPSVDPVKKVNGKDHDDLGAKDQVFTYTVTQFVPAGAESFHFEDKINEQIEYASDATVTIDKAGTGVIKTVAKPEGKELKFDLTKEELAQVVGHVVTVTFDAKYVDGIDDETLEGTYVGVKTETQGEGDEAKTVDVETRTDDPDAAHIGTPNRAKTKVGNHEANTNIVTTTAPPEISTPEKSIGNTADDQAEITRDAEGNVSNTPKLNLKGREDVFTYSVTQQLPANLKSVAFEDTLKDVLTFNGSDAGAKLVAEITNEDGSKQTKDVEADVNISGQKITVTPKSLDGLAGAKLTVYFEAVIKPGVTDDQLIAAGYTNNEIPNEATVVVNGSPLGTNEVFVKPPSEEESPEKKIIADSEIAADPEAEPHKGTSNLKTRSEEFTYVVSQKVPVGAYYLEFSDTIEEVLEFVGGSETASLTVDGADVEGAEIEHTSDRTIVAKVGTPTAPAEGEESPIMNLEGKTVVLTFKARLKADVDDDDLYGKYVEESLSVPNEATVTVNDNPLNTNKVYVTPPPETPEAPEKFVEGEKYGTPEEQLKEGETPKESYNLAKRISEVTYTVIQKVPVNAVNVQFIDNLERVLEVAKDEEGNNKVAVKDESGNAISEAIVRVVGNTIIANIDNEDVLKELTNKKVILEIVAKVRNDVTDEQLIEEYGEEREIPNTATVIIGNNSGTTNEVKITPPEEPEEPVKNVKADGEGTTNAEQTFATLAARDETFTYTIKQLVPENADTVTFHDTLEPVLEVISATINGAADYGDVKITPETNEDDPDVKYTSVEFSTEDATNDRGKEVTMTIVAKIRADVTDEDLVKRYETTVIPNYAVVAIDDDPNVTDTVNVTPPPIESEKPDKKVEGKDEHDLVAEDPNDADSVKAAREKEFEYTITQKVPVGAVRVDFEDTLASVLELYGENFGGAKITADVDGTETEIDADFATEEVEVKEREQTSKTIKLTAAVTDKTVLAQLADKTITMSFKAKIKTGVLDSELIEKFGSTRIPNKATVKINGNGKSTDERYVTPPETPGDSPEKKVEGKKHGTPAADLKEGETEEPAYKIANRMDEFTYTVSQKLPPEGFTKVVFSDKVEPVLEIVKNSGSVTGADGFVIEYSEDGRTITATKEDASADANAEVTLTFKAKLRAGITDKRLIEDYGEAMEIPNFATVSLDDQPKVTNEVTVTPPPSEHEDPKKEVTPDGEGIDVDGKHVDAKLMNRKETFTYTISQAIPAGAVNVKFTDILKDVLEVVGEPEVTVDGQKVESAEIDVIDSKAVSAEVKDASAYADKTMVLTIKAKIKDDVTDATLISLYGDARQIPNEATVTIDGDGKGTNKVKVTPPEEPKDPEKFINDQKEKVQLPAAQIPDGATPEQIDELVAAARAKTFDYKVVAVIPENASTFTITDVVEPELIIVDNGTFSEAGYTPVVSEDKKTITVEINDVQDKDLGLKEVTLKFTAKIAPEIKDSDLLKRPSTQFEKYEKDYNGTTDIPNKAEVTYRLLLDAEDSSKWTNTVEVTPPPTPSENPEKLVEGKEHYDIEAEEGQTPEQARHNTFEYTVSQKVPAGCSKLEFEDILASVLEVDGAVEVVNEAGDKLADGTTSAAKITERGEEYDTTRVYAIVEDEATLADLEGQKVTLKFNAKIKNNVLDSELYAKYGSTTVPNKATVKINGNGTPTNEVKVTPPDTPGEKPVKKVNGDTGIIVDETTGEPILDEEGNEQIVAKELANRTEKFTYTIDQKLPAEVTKVEFYDKVENVLVIDKKSAKIEGSKDASKYKIDVDGQIITAVAEDASADAGETVTLSFVANLKPGTKDEDLIAVYGESMEIPNTAMVTIDNNPKVSNEVKVTPPPVDRIPPTKEVAGIDEEGKEIPVLEETEDSIKLMNKNDTFTYTVSQVIPAGAVNVEFTDVLKEVLEVVGTPEVSVNGEKIDADVEVIGGQAVSAKVADATAYADQTMVLTIHAKIKETVTDQMLIALYGDTREIKNEATVTIDGQPKVTNEVKVTPPEEPEDPKKQINGDVAIVNLKDRAAPFVYTVTQKIPENAKTVTITDTIEPELIFVDNEGEAQKTDEGEEVKDNAKFNKDNTGVFSSEAGKISIEGKTIKVDIADAEAIRGETVTLTFTAAIDPSVDDAQLLAREGAYKRTTVIPNTAEVKFDFENDPRFTNTVEVTPPPTPSEEPEKKVDGEESLELPAADETKGETLEQARAKSFEYTVSQVVPADAALLEFNDTLASVLELVGDKGGANLTYVDDEGVTQTISASITTEKAEVVEKNETSETVKLVAIVDNEELLATLAGKKVTLTFTAKIKDGVPNSELISKFGNTTVPNKATVLINGNPKSTNEVKVTPPDKPGDKPEKTVGVDAASQSKDMLELEERSKVFTYQVSQVLPEEVTKVEFSDTIEPVLEFLKISDAEDAAWDASVEGDADYAINVNGRTITATSEDASADKGKKVTFTFKAKIRADVTDAQLIRDYGVEVGDEKKAQIPNQAIVTVDDQPRATNEVKVTPPPTETEEPEKTVEANGDGDTADDKKSAKLMNRDETFTYTVSQKIPNGAVNVQFLDVLEPVLVTSKNDVTFTVDGKPVEGANIQVSRDRVVMATVADASKYAEKTMILTIKAKIKDGVTDEDLIKEYGNEREIPNTADVTIDGVGKTTNEVLVTPPEEPEEPKKQINGDTARVELGARDEVFEYTVTQKIPENAKTATITDTIENELVFVDNAGQAQKTVDGETIVDNRAFNADNTGTATVDGKPVGTITISGKLIRVEIENASAIRGKEVVFTFKAAIDPSVTDAALLAREGDYTRTTVIPNVAFAEFDFAHDPLMTNTVEVTPPPTPSDEPEKKVGMTADDQSTDVLELAAEDENGNPIENPRAQTFTYTVSQLIPAGAVNVVFEDTLADVLEVKDASVDAEGFTVTVDPAAVNAAEESWTKDANNRTAQKVTATIADATQLADTTVTLTIKAKIKDGVEDKELIAKYRSTQVVNKATVKINGNPKTSNEVRVTPPPTPGERPVKTVSDNNEADKEAVSLDSKYEIFTYKVTQKLPEDAETVEFSDTVEPIVEIINTEADKPEVTGGEATYTVNVSEDGRTVTAVSADATADQNKYITLTFKAKIKAGTTEDQIAAYTDRSVPNTAIVTVNDNPKVSNKVTVTPPVPGTQDPVKKVEDSKNPVMLTNRDDTFTYTVSQMIPDGAINVVFEDKLERVLEVVGTPTLKNEKGEDVGEIAPVSGQDVKAEIADATAMAGQVITLTIEAKIKEGTTDEELVRAYKTEENPNNKYIPNVATVTIDGAGKVTNEVLVTPPGEREEPKKTVSKVKLDKRDEVFTYTVSQLVPVDATEVSFVDDIEDVLEVVSTEIDGKADYNSSKSKENHVEYETTDASLDRGKTVTLTIQAKIKEGITDQDLIDKYGSTDIPNEATVTIDGDGKGTNKVIVTPPDETVPDPEKKVNDGEKAVLADIAETFTYTVSQKIPAGAVNVKFEDTLERVLEVVGNPTLTKADGSAVGTVNPVSGQTVTAEIKDAKDLAYETVTLTIVAKIKAEFSADDIAKIYGEESEIPNKADVTIDDNKKTTNEVLVTPPEDREEPEKTVSKTKLDKRDEVFTYTVSQLVPANATTVSFVDDLEDVLEVFGTPVIDGAATYENKTDGNHVEFATKDATADRGKKVTLTIQAKIKDTVSDAELIAKYGSTDIPNKATVTIDGVGLPTNEVKVTPPDKPDTKPEKKINGAASLTLAEGERNKEFTYTVRRVIPKGAKTVEFSDTLERVLEVVGIPTLTKADGKAVGTVNAPDGQVVTAHIENATKDGLGGETVTLTIKAKIRADVTDAELVKDYGTAMQIPNKATVSIDGDGKVTNTVTVTPVPVGNVDVNYVTVTGEVLIPTDGTDWEQVVSGVKEGSDYTTSQRNIEGYEFVKVNTPDDEYNFWGEDAPTGKVVANKTLKVTYIYKKIISEPEKTVSKPVLDSRDEVFTYTVSQIIPKDAINVVFTDTLENVLEVVGTPTLTKADGSAVGSVVPVTSNTVTASIADATELYNQKVTLTINAKIKDGISDETLINLYGDTSVPNKATVSIDGAGKVTNEVDVTPPPVPEIPENPVKKINGATDPVALNARDEVFTYTVEQLVPKEIERLIITDTLEDVLEISVFAEDPSRFASLTFADGTAVPADMIEITISEDSQTIFASLIAEEGQTLDEFAGKTLVLTFNAKIKADVTDETLVEKYGYTRLVPNRASTRFSVDDEPRWTNIVRVTPPPTIPDPVGSVIVRYITTDGTILEGWRDVAKDAVPGTEYTTEEKKFAGYTFVEVPDYSADTTGVVEGGKTLEVTYVYEPITEEPPITKKVNNVDHYDLKRVFEQYTYTVTTKIPKNAVNFVVTDKLEPVIEFVSAAEEVSVRVNGQIIGGAAAIAGQTLTVTIPEDVVKTNPDAEVVIEFSARLREGANINAYMETTESPALIPNTAEYSYTDTQDIAHGKPSNEVTVTPPTRDPLPEPPVIPELKKFVNDDPNHADLTIRNEIFKYTLNTKISKNAVSFVITDTLVDELEFAGENGDVKVTIGGTDVTGELAKCEISGQTLTIELAYDHLVQREGQEVVVTFNAKIRDDVSEDVLIEKYGEISGKDERGNDVKLPHIPNEASITLNNDGGAHAIKSNIVTVTPPSREIKKLGLSVSKRILGGNDELAGAKLAIFYREADGSYVEIAIPVWTSGTEAHLVELTDGEYVLVETEAPEGYEISGPIHFRISGNGSVLEVLENGNWVAPKELNTIIMYDAKKQTPPTPTPTPTPGDGEEKTDTPGTTTPPTTPPGTPTTNPPGTPVTTRRVVTPSTSTATRATSTGDANSTTLWIVLAAIAAAAAAGAAVMVRRRRREDD